MRIAAAIDRQGLIDARRAFTDDVIQSLALLAIVLMLASWMQFAIGLRPLEAVRQSVMGIRAGRQSRIDVDEPDEVMPLVTEVNELLDAQMLAIERARARAADLAHGLKTPLTVLTNDAERLRAKGEIEMAAEIEELAAGMRSHIGRELTRARLPSTSLARPTPLKLRDVVEGVVRTLARAPRGFRVVVQQAG